MYKSIFVLISSVMVVAAACAAEREIFSNPDGKCTIERANGLEDPIECPKNKIKTLSESEINASIASLAKFEQSELVSTVNIAF